MINYKLILERNWEGLIGYTDADWALQDHRHLISAYVFQIDGGIISWSYQKQSIIALSTSEAEFITLTHVTKEALWILHFITELFQPLNFLVKLYSDTQSAIAISYSNQQHVRTKHFNIRLYFIQDTIENKKIRIECLPTDQMLADILTKKIPGPKVKILTEKISILGLRGCVGCIYASRTKNSILIFFSIPLSLYFDFKLCLQFFSIF